MEQSTRSGTVSQGRACVGVAPVWHWMQAFLAWAEPASTPWSTNIDRPALAGVVPTRSFRAWHFRHSVSAMPSS